MNKPNYLAYGAGVLWTLLIVALMVATVPSTVAQTGYNAICTSTSPTCASISPSSAAIDATAFCSTPGACTTSDDFCLVVNKALHALPSAGGVVDARGINSGGTGSAGNSCGSTDTPFSATYNIKTPSVLLLPSGTIKIYSTWILPSRTRIIGEGNNPVGGTQIQGASASISTMIQMGSPITTSYAYCSDNPSVPGQCYGISVEDLYLNGEGQAGYVVNGIVNSNAGPLSYVDHVNFYEVEGIGLQICGVSGVTCLAEGSGPYSNLNFSAAQYYNSSTECILLAASSTKGVHSVTCTAYSNTTIGPLAGIQLDSSSNILEDIHFEGYQDGVRVGWDGAAQGDVLLNINGGAGKDSMTNVIHICGSTSLSTPFTPCSTSNTVSDLTIEGVLATASGSFNVTNLLEDDATETIVPRLSSPNETTMARYTLGEGFAGGYSRFTTLPIILTTSYPPAPVPAWGVGTANPSNPCSPGSIFSYPGGGSGSTLWVCKSGGSWSDVK